MLHEVQVSFGVFLQKVENPLLPGNVSLELARHKDGDALQLILAENEVSVLPN